MEGWTRNSYELSDYGLYENDVTGWDASRPAGSTVAAVINNASWDDAAYPNAPDLQLQSWFNPLDSWKTGDDTSVAAFRLTVPRGTAPDQYNIGLRHSLTADFPNYIDSDLQDSNFTLTVNSKGDVPEPSTLALGLVGLAGPSIPRRRRG